MKLKKLPKNKKVIFFCAHPDDDAFSSGGLIFSLAKNKNKVIIVYLSSGKRGVVGKMPDETKKEIRKVEGIKACRILGAEPYFLNLDNPTLKENKNNIKKLKSIIDYMKPDIIFTHPSDDAHPTHRVANRIVTKAINLANPENRPKLVLNFETWRPFDKPDFIFPFDENVMRVKIKAMKQHKSQMRRADFLNIFVSLNLFRGIMGMGLLRSCVRKISKKHRKRIRRVYGEAFLIQRLQRSK